MASDAGKAIACLLFLAALPNRSFALDPSRPFGNYLQAHFSPEGSLPSGIIDDIVQSRDGFLWLIGERPNPGPVRRPALTVVYVRDTVVGPKSQRPGDSLVLPATWPRTRGCRPVRTPFMYGPPIGMEFGTLRE